MKRRKPDQDRRELSLRLDADGIHDDADGEPALLLVPTSATLSTALDMERIVACVNACRGIATENLAIVSALDDAERAFINERAFHGWGTETMMLNRGVADEIVEKRVRRDADKPTIEQKIDRILAAVERRR